MTEFKVGDRVELTRDMDPVIIAPSGSRGSVVEYNPGHTFSVTLMTDDFGLLYVGESDVSVVSEEETPEDPSHYKAGLPEGVEVIDIIRAQGWDNNFYLANAAKYLLRCEHKGQKKADLLKLKVYVDWELERL